MATTVSGFNVSEAAQSNNDSSAVGPVAWEVNKNKLIAQMGGIQAIGLKAGTDIYKNRSPLDADTHITNIATSLARDYGVTNITDIGVRDVVRPGYASGSDESYTYIPDETVPEFYNKTTNQVIPSYKFASEGRGDGYSDYNLQAIKQADGSFIAMPIQSYNKSGFGAVQEAMAPILPVLAVALMATGAGAALGQAIMGGAASASAATAVGSAALNLGMQGFVGNINSIEDAIKIVAPSAVTFGISELADVANAANAASQVLPRMDGATLVSPFTANTSVGELFERVTGIGGKTADAIGGAISGALSASITDNDVNLGAITGAAQGLMSESSTKNTKVAPIEEANPFKSSFEITPTTLTSAPENTDALAKALGVETFSIPSNKIITLGSALDDNGRTWRRSPFPETTTTVSSINDQTNELFEPFSKETFMPGKFTGVSSNAMVGTDTGGITNLNLTGNFPVTPSSSNADSMAGMLGQVGSGASNLTGTLGNVSDLDLTGINRGLSTLTTAVTPTKIADTAAVADKQMSVTDLTKIGASMVGAAAAGSALDSTNKTTTIPTSSAKATYANAPIKGFRMQKMQNEGGLTTYIPYINQTSLLPVPTGYKSI